MKIKFFRLLILFSIVSLVAYLFIIEISEFEILKRENHKLKSKSRELSIENELITTKIQMIKEGNTRYLEKIIREELGMIKQSEKIYQFE